MMDSVCAAEVKLISYLQTTFGAWEQHALLLSRFGDPRNSFLIYFPAAFHVNSELGLNVLWSAILSEWINLILKWVLRGDRPYWWIRETTERLEVNLTQYELTCETGPGSPSGHAMVTASVWFLITAFFVTQLSSSSLSLGHHHLTSTVFRTFSWSAFVVMISLVSASRVFIATHFPHQVLLGAVVGVVLSNLVRRSQRFAGLTNLFHCFVVSLILLGSSLACYHLLLSVLFDPSLSVRKAQRWCANPSFIHLDTTPFYALVRDAGAAFGIGIATCMDKVFGSSSKHAHNTAGLILGGLQIMLSISCLQTFEQIMLPRSSVFAFYVAGYVKNAFLPVTVVFLVPCICRFANKHCKRFCQCTKQQ